ncbi:BQ5605_C027g10382 [Microbotryum silenes-dioicae]|uniref:BQ5605_C027g10382 protein n=1 Tax=Microbotryum silenes-dioicae TaxID=796604 RepID=A0A2X0NG24_9BASI|nr:BQ5605_C027g10382 [Microbotryum silenes-dioicae]
MTQVGQTKENITVALSLDNRPNQPGNLTLHSAPASSWAKHNFDFQFSGPAQQCGTQALCRSFEAEHRWNAYKCEEEQNEYKYVLDVDGNGRSGRFRHLMASNSLVLAPRSAASELSTERDTDVLLVQYTRAMERDPNDYHSMDYNESDSAAASTTRRLPS